MSNIITSIEQVAQSVLTSVETKLTSIKDGLENATADVVKKTVAVAHSAEQIAQSFVQNVEKTWTSLDNTSEADLVADVIKDMGAGNYESAAETVTYLVYQKLVEVTNKVKPIVEADIKKVETVVEGVASKAWSDVKTAATDVESTLSTASKVTVVGVTSLGETILKDLKSGEQWVVSGVEKLFGINTNANATSTANTSGVPNTSSNGGSTQVTSSAQNGTTSQASTGSAAGTSGVSNIGSTNVAGSSVAGGNTGVSQSSSGTSTTSNGTASTASQQNGAGIVAATGNIQAQTLVSAPAVAQQNPTTPPVLAS